MNTPARSRKVEILTMSDVEAEDVQWLWTNRIPRGKLTLLCGAGGVGKSYLTLDIAARLSRGTPWPDCPIPATGQTLLLGTEDGVRDTVKPRLIELGADCSKVHSIRSVGAIDDNGEKLQEPFRFDRHLPYLAELLDELGDVALLVVDPIEEFLGNADSYKSADVRAVLGPLGQLAEKHNVAVIVIAHPTKAKRGSALSRASGSQAFGAYVRSGWMVVPDADDRERVLLLPTKASLSRWASGLAYRVVDGIHVGRVEWEAGSVDVSAEDALAALDDDKGTPSRRADAKDWLRKLLATGDVLSKRVMELGKEAGHARNTIWRAKGEIGIKCRKAGGKQNGEWWWSLPDDERPNNPAKIPAPTASKHGDLDTVGILDPQPSQHTQHGDLLKEEEDTQDLLLDEGRLDWVNDVFPT